MDIKQKFMRSPFILAVSFSALVLSACQSTSGDKESAVDEVRENLIALQSDSRLASLAQLAVQDAERAVRAAEEAEGEDLEAHLVYIANNKVEEARALATARYEQDRLKKISEQRQQMRLSAAAARAESLEAQLADLKQRKTERGTIFTLGDALFATGKADLKAGVQANLDRLAQLLQQYPDRKVLIEGHTDNVGSEDSNMALSQRRAESVKNYLVARGVPSAQISTIGKGESFPVTTNDTSSGRQQNRRVEVIIENPANQPIQ